jgi:hypothetical protein
LAPLCKRWSVHVSGTANALNRKLYSVSYCNVRVSWYRKLEIYRYNNLSLTFNVQVVALERFNVPKSVERKFIKASDCINRLYSTRDDVIFL